MVNNTDKLMGAAAMFAEKFNVMRCKATPDGGGGYFQKWRKGLEFEAALSNNKSNETRIAEAQEVASAFVFAIPIGVSIKFDDYLKRQKDGAYYRVTSDPEDVETFPGFPVQEKHFSAQKVEALPK